MRKRRGTTPHCRAGARPLVDGCDGPTRSALLGLTGCSSEGSPVIAGSTPLQEILRAAANQHQASAALASARLAAPSTKRVLVAR